MSNKAKAAFNVLGAHANWETGECFLAVSTIAKEAGYQRRAMFYAINELEERGAIIVKRKLGEVNHYLIVHYQNALQPEADDLSARPAGADDDGRQAEALAPAEDGESQRQDGNGGQLQGQEEAKQLEIPFDNKDNITLSVQDVNNQQPAEDKKQQKGQTLAMEESTHFRPLEEAEKSDGQQKQQCAEDKPKASEVSTKEENNRRLIIGGMHINATPSADKCTTPCIKMHDPVQTDAPKQKQANGNINFPYNNTPPPVDKWYRELSQPEQAYVLCCTKNINKVIKSVLGNFIPPLFIMEKLMVGFEPQFLIKIIKNCNAPMILNPIGWFRDIKPWWHVKGESPEEYWKRMAGFGMKPFFGFELEEESTDMSEETENSLDEDKENNTRRNVDDTQQEEDEGISYDGTLSPRAQQTIRLMNQYNSMLADAQMVYSLAQEEDATDEEKVDLIFHYHEIREKGKKVLDRIEEFGYIGNQEQMESGFVIDEVIIKLKQFRD